MIRRFWGLLSFFLLFPVVSQAQDDASTPFMTRHELPDSVRYLPPPPSLDSIDFRYDWSRYIWGKSVRNSPRGELARENADYRTEYIAEIFSIPFGFEISESNSPEIYKLFSRAIETSKQSVRKAKKFYSRKRPFVQFGEPTLVPEHEEFNRTSGSYPSGHTAMGWMAALILSELNPERAEALLKLGYEYGQSRVIVGYHYQSDVDAGRLAATSAYSVLHANSEFLSQIEKARRELERLRRESAM